MFKKLLTLLFVLTVLLVGMTTALAAEPPLITSVDELANALMNANAGDTILVGDITFNPMPMGMIVVPKNVTIRSGGDTNAVFTNATFALNGTATDSAPLTVRFENIDFCGDQAGTPIDPASPPCISSEMPDIMKTMCAAIFKMNVNAAYIGCTFEGYHYGYGGVFNAIYSSDEDDQNALDLTLEDCVFRNNAAKFGGGIYLSGDNHNIHLDARRCVFENNAAAAGGAVWAKYANVDLLECTFVGNRFLNEALDQPNGGALALLSCGAELDGCVIANNASGGAGAGIFCEISPFKTLIMENCTVVGNVAAEDEGISVALAKTNYDTSAAAHIYFSSLLGTQALADRADLFGCLLVDGNAAESAPGEENGCCLTLTPESAEAKGLLPETPGHVSLPKGEYPVPTALTEAVAGGKFSNSLGLLQVGDNYAPEAVIEIETAPGRTEAVTVRYKDKFLPGRPERSGYAFEGWDYPAGNAPESGKVFLGGDLPGGKVTARWRFLLSEHLYVIWLPLLVPAAIAALVFYRRKKKVSPAAVPVTEAAAEETPALPEDWIDRVCEKPEMTELISKREMDVLHKLLEGKSRKQIAEELFITESTVKKHTTSIYAKLNVSGKAELISRLAGQ